MLQVKSFKISDGEGISALLRQYRLAEGANMLITNGEIAVPYEDGEPMNKVQTIIFNKELMNEENNKMDLIIHSQKVLEIQNNGVKKQIEDTKAKINYTPGNLEDKKANLDVEKEVKRLENVLTQNENQILMNQAEITRMLTNIAVHEETIANLSK